MRTKGKRIFMTAIFMFMAAVMAIDVANAAQTKQDAGKELTEALAMINKEMAGQGDADIVCEKVVIEGNNVVFKFKCDESDVSISEFESVIGEMKKDMKKEMKGSDMKAFVKAAVSAGKGIVYRYTGAQSKKSINVSLSLEELKEIVK